MTGAPEREIQVYCDPQKLEAYNLTVEGISGIIAQENLNTPGGSIDIGSNTYSLRVQGSLQMQNRWRTLLSARMAIKLFF